MNINTDLYWTWKQKNTLLTKCWIWQTKKNFAIVSIWSTEINWSFQMARTSIMHFTLSSDWRKTRHSIIIFIVWSLSIDLIFSLVFLFRHAPVAVSSLSSSSSSFFFLCGWWWEEAEHFPFRQRWWQVTTVMWWREGKNDEQPLVFTQEIEKMLIIAMKCKAKKKN